TDALCMVEVLNGIERVYACTIPNKSASTLMQIISSQVAENKIIWTDEHKSYLSLSNLGYEHAT
ncbi:hypothetical protein COBT_004230, partial [Conglomerata obtusa]